MYYVSCDHNYINVNFVHKFFVLEIYKCLRIMVWHIWAIHIYRVYLLYDELLNLVFLCIF